MRAIIAMLEEGEMSALPSIAELAKRLRGIAVCFRLTSQWVPLSLAYFFRKAKQLRYPCTVQLRTGEVLTLREFTDLVIFWLIFVRQHYPVKPTDRVIVDVGANVGLFTVYASRSAPHARIFAVEPFPETRERLGLTIRANGLEDRVTILPYALTNSEGTATMDDSNGVPSQYRAVLSEIPQRLNANHKPSSRPENSVSVSTLSLSDLLDRIPAGIIDLMKMNIHGNEYDALLPASDAALSRVRRIALQYHEPPKRMRLGKNDIRQKLESAGFYLVTDADTNRGSGRAIFALTPQSLQHVPRPALA